MTARLGRVALAAVALVSGTYVFVYLIRWEWDRATISALVFVASEVLLVASLLVSRLNRLTAQLERVTNPRVLARITESRPPPRVTFDWLDPSKGRVGVLVPVLMGAGVVLGGLAFAVERLARLTAAPVAERELARRLNRLELPSGGLLPGPGTGVAAGPMPPRRPWRAAGSAVLVVLLLATGVLVLTERLQTRPDRDVPPVTVVQLSVEGKRTGATTGEIAAGLWSSCRATVPAGTEAQIDVGRPGTGVAWLTLEPGLGSFGARKLVGCLGDLRIERVRATDVSVVVPAGRSD
jgi:hypothetical protein